MNEIKTFAVKNKEIAMKLINKGFELLNLTVSRDDQNKQCYIFEKTDEFKEAFDKIVEGIPKKNIGLSDFEKMFIADLLTMKKNEYAKMNINTNTIDSIILKLKVPDDKSLKEDNAKTKYTFLNQNTDKLKDLFNEISKVNIPVALQNSLEDSINNLNILKERGNK